jgi:hypothetical protein
MNISATINTAKVMAALKKAQPSPQQTKRALGRAASEHILNMLKRVDSGSGLKGVFRAYHPKYAMFRSSKGRSASKVNLQFTGRMLANVSLTSISPSKAVIGFSSETERRKAIANQKRRPWFGVNNSEQNLITSRFIFEIFKK